MNKCLLVEARYDCRSKDKRKDFSDNLLSGFSRFSPGFLPQTSQLFQAQQKTPGATQSLLDYFFN